MIGVDKTGDMRRRARRGEAIAAIARAVGVSEPTARKYARMDDLSPEPPRRRKPESEVLAPYEGTTDSWPDDDCRNWRKQRHTAVRVYVRLRDELGYDGSYSTVRRHAGRRREEMARERDRRDAEGFLTPGWLPGEVQADFGEADLGVRGVVTRGKRPAVTFPHPDVGPAQVFWGETSECVCQGLRNVFEFAGGVPRRAVFDNATEVGRRVGGEVRREGTLGGPLADVAKARILVLDEFGHVPLDEDGARLPCQVMSESYERGSVISATNVESGRWGAVLADDRLAAAIVDRVARHGGLVEFGARATGRRRA